MKLWSAIFVICLLASTVQGVFAAQGSGTGADSDLFSEAPLNPEYIEYKNAVSHDQSGVIPEPADKSHLKGKKVSKKALEAEVQGISDVSADETGEIVSAAPATYDLRTLGRVSPVKNQGSCGSCWAFASYGSMESEALPTQLFDFSEDNLKNTHGFDLAPCSGGNAGMATAYLARWSGAVAEADDPYSATSTTSPTGLPVQEHAQEILTIPSRSGPLDNDNIKSALQTTGALYTTMYWSDISYNATTGAYYYKGTSGTNHAVTIVGWDDTYSRFNFNYGNSIPGDGAFIVKNSWGTSWGNNGYFYVSYYDSLIGKSLTAYTGESAANYDHIYQYDPFGWISSTGYSSDTAWAANVFTATSQEAVSAVGLTTNQINTAYQISIYTSPTQGPINSAGPVTTVQGTIGIPGYHTVKLPTPVKINSGQKFSVVVKFQTPNFNYPITFEKPVGGYTSQATASAGQSYISSTGTTWTDLTTKITNANVCLKAYTVNTASTSPSITVTSPNGGESWVLGSSHDIAWTSSGDVGSYVKIEVLKAGTVVQTLSSSTANDGSFTWTISTALATGTDYSIRITSTANTAIKDTSNTYFTLAPAPSTSSITVTSPNGGESWVLGSSHDIAWTSSGDVGSYVKIEVLKAGTVVQTLSSSTANDGSFTWTISTSLATGTDYSIRITSTANTAIKDTSNTNFALAPASSTSSITVTSPNGGESWVLGSSHYITWTSSGDVGSYVKIEVLKAGTVVQTLSSSTPNDGSYSWTISTSRAAGSDYRVRITSTATTTITDMSNTYFTLASAETSTPVADFTGTPTTGPATLTTTFTDTSTNSPTSWAWTFGDGTTSTLQHPSHTYSAAGTYTVSLKATNAGGSNTLTRTGYITVSTTTAAPVAGFTGTPTSGSAPLAVAFTDTSTNSPTSWYWTFGDGTTSTLQHPSHTYSAAGTYTVSLKATNAGGSNTLTRTGYITVSSTAVAPVAGFTGTPTSGSAPLTVAFTDTSTNSPTSWAWTFGDGGTSTLKNPVYTYTTSGIYTVTLKATNAGGSSQVVMKNYIKVRK